MLAQLPSRSADSHLSHWTVRHCTYAVCTDLVVRSTSMRCTDSPRRLRRAAASGGARLSGSMNYYSWFVFEFWRFQFVQKEVAKLAQTAIEYPPMQPGASFNLEAVEAQIQKAQEAA